MEQAIESFQRALVLFKQLGYVSGEGLALSNLGLCAVTQGEFTRAIALYERALKLANSTADPYGKSYVM